MKKIFALFLSLVLIFSVGCGGSSDTPSDVVDYGNVENVKNIILLIGDGMGQEQIRAGNIEKEGNLTIVGMPNRVLVETKSLDSTITDSAAAGTAMATGVRTKNGYVGLDADEEFLTTIVDIAHGQGKSTGIITTEELYGATPMAFSAHGTSRADYQGLMESAARSSNVNLFVAAGNIESYSRFTNAGYQAIADVGDISESDAEKIIGAYPITATETSMTDYSFDRIVVEVLEYLSKNENGFFLMAEGAHIDHGGHANDIMYMLRELFAFDSGVKAALEWAKRRNDTVVLVSADHETGGLTLGDDVNADNMFDTDDDGNYINISWSSTGHTDTDVYLYLYGMKMDYAAHSSFKSKDRIKNTDIFAIMNSFFTAATV
ncbi:MAG: alkaline phosphatase [Clostridia bacterium]|nr:alkaline phosphatase [Clostridia bacterium]